MTRVDAVLVVCLAATPACGRYDFDPVGGDAAVLDGADGREPDSSLVCGASFQAVPGFTSKYLFLPTSITWQRAEASCVEAGGHLVVIDSPAENAMVVATIAGAEAWIGLTDTVANGTFTWVNEEPLGFSGFANGEPTESNQIEDCVMIRADGSYWDDRACNGLAISAMCECDGLPEAPFTFCDTDADLTCGDCSTACSDATCLDQRCIGSL